jgi:polysaccharide export outer membrane protein
VKQQFGRRRPTIKRRGYLGNVALALLAMPALAHAQALSGGADPFSSDDGQAAQAQAAPGGSSSSGTGQLAVPAVQQSPFQPADLNAQATSGDAGGDEARREERRDRAFAAARPAKPNEFEYFVSTVADKPLRRFGSSLLVPGARDFTAPPTVSVPPDYRLNPGDELIVSVTGAAQASGLRLVLDSEGRVTIPRVGAVNLGGVRYADAEGVLSRQIARQYRDFRVDVSVGRLHGITVYVTGFVATPGSYTVSSLSTLANAVLAAGGPSAGGSFRSIQLRRGGRLLSDFDLYDLLLKGDKSGDMVLQSGDVIFVAPVGRQVAVIGSVNQEAIFEAAPKDTLYDVLLYAGGVSTVADDSRLLVLDPLDQARGGWQELTPQQIQTRAVSRGEIVRVLSAVGIARPLEQQPVLVTISGEVARPGRYYFQPGTQMSVVIEKAGGLTTRAFPYASIFTRESVRRQQRVSYDRALKDMELLLTTQPLVSANRDARLQPAALAAVQSVVSQLRAREPDGRLVLDLPVAARGLPGDVVLENNDSIHIPAEPVTVGVFGAVPNPASFGYVRGRTIGDFLKKAGGIQKLGDKSGIFVVRANGSVIAARGGLFGHGILDEQALPGDLLYVPVDANRGEFWAKLRDITSVFFNGAIAAATVVAVTDDN